MNNEVNIKHNKIEVEDGHIVFGKSKKRVKKNALQLLKATAMELKPVRDITEVESIDKDMKEDEKRTKEITLLKKQMATPGQTVNQFLLQKYSDNINTAVSLIDQYDNSKERIKAGLNYEYHVYFPENQEFDSLRVNNKYIVVGPIKDYRLGDLYYYHIPIYVKENTTVYTTDYGEELNMSGSSKNKDGLVHALSSFKTAIEKQSLTLKDAEFKIVKSYGLLTDDNKIKLDIVGNMKVEKYLLSIAPDKKIQALEYLNSVGDIKEERVNKLQEQYDDLLDKMKKLEQENKELKDRKEKLRKDVGVSDVVKTKDDIKKLKKKIVKENTELKKLENEDEVNVDEVIKKENTIEKLKSDIENKEKVIEVNNEIAVIDDKVKKIEDEVKTITTDANNVTERIDTIVKTIEQPDDSSKQKVDKEDKVDNTEYDITVDYDDKLSLYENLIANNYTAIQLVRNGTAGEDLRVYPLYIINPVSSTFYIIVDKFGFNPGLKWKEISEINEKRAKTYIEMMKNNKLKQVALGDEHKAYLAARKLTIKGVSPMLITRSSEFIASPPDISSKIKKFHNK